MHHLLKDAALLISFRTHCIPHLFDSPASTQVAAVLITVFVSSVCYGLQCSDTTGHAQRLLLSCCRSHRIYWITDP